ncbi:hypothetical protein NDU88_006531 [Pleurodeles waltl]|uniref:Uncharacterized protein n=1 Tax=Pleurodeles waltl TaxID=8319 RepID=A0AAV7PL98_PLEWA|nr:hypothetical protein NDU88_006531 [Pleurodeles waltl]
MKVPVKVFQPKLCRTDSQKKEQLLRHTESIGAEGRRRLVWSCAQTNISAVFAGFVKESRLARQNERESNKGGARKEGCRRRPKTGLEHIVPWRQLLHRNPNKRLLRVQLRVTTSCLKNVSNQRKEANYGFAQISQFEDSDAVAESDGKGFECFSSYAFIAKVIQKKCCINV